MEDLVVLASTLHSQGSKEPLTPSADSEKKMLPMVNEREEAQKRLNSERLCHVCKLPGHLRKDCPHANRADGKKFCANHGISNHWTWDCRMGGNQLDKKRKRDEKDLAKALFDLMDENFELSHKKKRKRDSDKKKKNNKGRGN
mmetsp:Transcript_13819/g.19028  ORF Transcript_13819/g.19028 Transcript_13819/m.19028 type:complete len:143 (+) Transcript_13819:1285-1713(+)